MSILEYVLNKLGIGIKSKVAETPDDDRPRGTSIFVTVPPEERNECIDCGGEVSKRPEGGLTGVRCVSCVLARMCE